ncbi:hypothetical protein [Shewanella sp.]|uniref:hypothetical protein n=1 Tax=Shewanella sp. TaxID=50422 RepID=UPI003A9855A7
MDFRCWLSGIVLCLLSLFTRAAELEPLVLEVYQYPKQAAETINQLEQQADQLSSTDLVRLQLLRCQLLIQQGDNQSAVELSRQGQLTAINHKLDIAVPYFGVCQAEAYQNIGMIERALPLLDNAAMQAKKNTDQQLLVSVLRIRAEIENTLSNYAAAIEDLRIAMDIYPEISLQNITWAYPPLAYIYADMASVLTATDDPAQALHYLSLAKADVSATGKVSHLLSLMYAYVAVAQGKVEQGKEQLELGVASLNLVESDIEKATSYMQISAVYLMLDDLPNAVYYNDAATAIFNKFGTLPQTINNARHSARIKLRQGDIDGALAAIEESLEIAKALSQPSDVAIALQLKAQIFYHQEKYKEAYQAINSAMAAYKEGVTHLSNTQFMQYKAKLSLQEQQQSKNQLEVKESSLLAQKRLNRAHMMIYLLLVVIAMLLLWIILKRYPWQATKQKPTVENDEKWAETAIETAKTTASPLSLLVVNINHVQQIVLPQLQEELTHKLREQDKIIGNSLDKLLIILPYTSEDGALRVLRQLEPVVNQFSSFPTSIGYAELRQPDSLQSLVKRAQFQQLSRAKERGIPPQPPLA